MTTLKHIKKIKLEKNDMCWSVNYTKIPGFNLIFEKLLELVKEYKNKKDYIDCFNLFLDNNSKYHYEKTKNILKEKEYENYLKIEKNTNLIHKNNNRINFYNNELNKLKKNIIFNKKKISDEKKIFKENLNIIIKNKINQINKMNEIIINIKTINKNIINLKQEKINIININLNNNKIDHNTFNYFNNIEKVKNIYKKNIFKKDRLGNGAIVILDNDEKKNKFDNYFKTIYGNNNRITGFFWYPPGGFREWHTNAYNAYGWRLYLVYVEEEGKSSFNFIHPKTKKFVSLLDKSGYINMFKVGTSSKTMFWHNVRSDDTHRFSIGINVTQEFIDTFFEFI